MSDSQDSNEERSEGFIDSASLLPAPPKPPTMEEGYRQVTVKRMKLKSTQYRFRRACDQIVLLNRRMESVLQRYYKARSEVNRSFRYKLRLRLAIVEGIRNMYYDYANQRASEIVVLRRDLFGEIVEIVSDNIRRGHDAEEVESHDDDTSDEESSFEAMEEDLSP